MKNITAYLYKLTIIATSLVMVYFVSGVAAIAQANELLKAEPIEQKSLIEQAKQNLALSFSTLQVNTNMKEKAIKTVMMTKENSVNNSKAATLSNTVTVSE
ncbi:MAG: hypothetical protein QF552_10100 [Litorilituus sp.]|jgi:methionine-rich copper-binding protein CopC|nr:hypothetical protein [Litorilituus sp.]